jgi:hypothetical protein
MLCGETVAVYCDESYETEVCCVGRMQGPSVLKNKLRGKRTIPTERPPLVGET